MISDILPNSTADDNQTFLALAPQENVSNDFQTGVTDNFTKSGVAKWLQSPGLEFVTAEVIAPHGEVFPIAEFLGWKIRKERWKSQKIQKALLMWNEDRSPWQAILDKPTDKKPYQYLAPTQAGNKAFLPHVPLAPRRAIADRYQITDPAFLNPENSFWDWIENNPELPLVVTEGAKKALSLLQQGYVAIALYGCTCLGSSDLDRFLPRRKVTIAMDSDLEINTRIKVDRAVLKGSKILSTKGAKAVTIATWNSSFGKGIDDLQVLCGVEAVNDALKNSVSRTAYQKIHQKFISENKTKISILKKQADQVSWDKWLKFRAGYTPDATFSSQYVGLDFLSGAIKADTSLLSLRSGLGTGKTQVLPGLINYLEQLGKGSGVIAIGSRNTLLLQTCERLNFYHLHEHSAHGLLKDSGTNIALCFDSLHHYKDKLDCFNGKIIVLDEVVSVVKHALTSSTCKDRRSELLNIFSEAIKRAGVVICFDGNSVDTTVNYLTLLRGNDNGVVKLLNEYQNKNTPFETISSFNHSEIIAKILEVAPIYSSQNKSFAIATDSQKMAEKLDLILTKLGHDVLRIDSKTVTSKEIKRYIQKPDYRPEILIYSPSAESGLDVNLDGFTHTFGIFYGVVDAQTQIQKLHRVRKVDRITVSCVPYKRRDNSKPSLPDEFINELENRLLQDSGNNSEGFVEWFENQRTSPHTQHWVQEQIAREFEKLNTYECLLELAKVHGYDPIEIDLESDRAVLKQLTTAGQDIDLHDAKQIFNARDLSPSEANSIRVSFTASLDDRYALQKFEIKDTLPGIERSEFWTLEGIRDIRKHWDKIRGLTLLWHTQNLDKSERISGGTMAARISKNKFIGDCSPNYFAKAKMIKALELLDMTDLEFNADTAAVTAIATKGTNKRKGIRSILGLVMGKLTPIAWMGRLLNLIGLKTESRQVKGQLRVYRIADRTRLDETIFLCLSARLEKQYQTELERYQMVENNIQTTGAGDTEPVENLQENPPPPITPPPIKKYQTISRAKSKISDRPAADLSFLALNISGNWQIDDRILASS